MATKKYREVLLFVAGTTPQIITETIYALIHKKPPVYPDEIVVLTTTLGKQIMMKNLFDSGKLRTFCREFDLSENMLNEESILVVKDHEGSPLDDIRDSSDNECLGNFITAVIREKTCHDNIRLHCSLAGGRKTMSFYLGSALQLFGRPWDRLYHVLVTPEFEARPDFYYKPKQSKTLENDGVRLSTKDAEIYLAELPFIRLREKIHLDGKEFKELVSEGQKEIDTALTQPFVTVHMSENFISIGDVSVELKPFHIVFYAFLLRQKIERCIHPERLYCHECTDCFVHVNDLGTPGVTEAIGKDYELIYGPHSDHVANFRLKWKDGMDMGKLRSDRSKINRDIIENLEDETLSTYYTITSLRKYGATRFGVKVEKGKIRIERNA